MSEIKYAYADNVAAFDAFSNYEVYVTPNFPQGVNKNNRIGNRIRYKFLQLRMVIACAQLPAAAAPFNIIRVILWQPRQIRNVTANPLNNTQVFNTASPLSSINPTGCRILMDKTHYFSRWTQQMEPINIAPARFYKKKVRISNNVNFFSSTELTPSDPKDMYYLTIVTNASAINQAQITLQWYVRISYTDI